MGTEVEWAFWQLLHRTRKFPQKHCPIPFQSTLMICFYVSKSLQRFGSSYHGSWGLQAEGDPHRARALREEHWLVENIGVDRIPRPQLGWWIWAPPKQVGPIDLSPTEPRRTLDINELLSPTPSADSGLLGFIPTSRRMRCLGST